MARPEIGALLALQQFDLEIARAHAESEALRRALAAQAPGPAEIAYARARATLKACREEQSSAEAALDVARTRRSTQEARLYSGKVLAKDLDVMQREVAHLRAAEEAENERVFEHMMASEEAEQELARAEQTLREVLIERAARQREQRERLDHLEHTLTDLEPRRASQAALLSQPALSRYEALRVRFGGRALVEVSGNICQACRTQVSGAMLVRASTGSTDAVCDNCGRMIYMVGSTR